MSGLVSDMTNFATFIDSTDTRAPITQRGKAKQKRADLRLVGLSLEVTTDGQVPVVSHVYEGNRPDVTQFTDVVDEPLTRWSALWGNPNSLTVTYDAGQNSKLNHTHIEETGIGFVTSLPPSQHRDLLAGAHSDYTNQAGLDLSVRGLLAALAAIQGTVLLYQGDRGRPRARRIITDLDPTHKRLYNLFDLDRYAPQR